MEFLTRRQQMSITRLLACLVGAVIVSGCEVNIPRDPHRITMAIARDVNSLDPAASFIVTNQLSIDLAYEKLVVAEVSQGSSTGRIVGQLAERWEQTPDGLTWTFFLRRGHRFDDGREVDAEAVKFSFERTLKLKLPPSQFLFFLRDVEVVDPFTVRFRLRTPLPFFLEVLAVPTSSIVNPRVMVNESKGDFGGRWLSTHTAGSGPYRVERFVRGEKVVLRTNPHAATKPSYFDEVNFVVIKDDATRAIQLAKGAVDIVDPLPGNAYRWLQKQPGVDLVDGLSPTVVFLHMNNERAPFKDPRVRKAISLAIDRDLIGQSIYRGKTRRLYGVLPEGVAGHDATLPLPEYDPKAARALLAEAGVESGTRVKLTIVGDNATGSAPTASAVLNQLVAIGLEVDVERISTAARTKIMKGDYDLTLQSINLDFPDPSIVFNFVYNSAMIGAANLSRYRNAAVDKLITRADQTLDSTERHRLYQEAQRIVVGDSPNAVLFQLDWPRAARSDISGINYNYAQPGFYNFATMRRDGKVPLQ